MYKGKEDCLTPIGKKIKTVREKEHFTKHQTGNRWTIYIIPLIYFYFNSTIFFMVPFLKNYSFYLTSHYTVFSSFSGKIPPTPEFRLTKTTTVVDWRKCTNASHVYVILLSALVSQDLREFNVTPQTADTRFLTRGRLPTVRFCLRKNSSPETAVTYKDNQA